jgi:DAK2 domain fusion protein YloV
MKSLNGVILKRMIISGANNLYNHYPEVDALNVFPVPDGDTGLNMNLTVSSGSKEVANRNDENIYDLAKAFSKGLLMGARGNSGVITSQIFRGFAQYLEGKAEINAVQFAEAWMQGKEVAYKAVMRPVEGTMLTVIREASQMLLDHVQDSWSIEQCMELLIKEAHESLKRTPDLLPILKEVGVVDSGGLGLIKILEGFDLGLKDQVVEKLEATALTAKAGKEMAGAKLEAEEFGYCTEFILMLDENNPDKKPFIEKRFYEYLEQQGNSIVLVKDENLVKVHIHTLNPAAVFANAFKYGEFVTMKADNMTVQHENITEASKEHAHAPASKPAEPVEEKVFGLIAVAAGAGMEQSFKDLSVDHIVSGGQTMNPSTEDFLNAARAVHAKNVFFFPNNPNIVLAAKQAAEALNEEGLINAAVIETKTIPEGLTAVINFIPDLSMAENIDAMNTAVKQVKSGAVTFAIKDTSINGLTVKKDDFMGIMGKAIVCTAKDLFDTAKKLLETMVDDAASLVTIFYGEGASDAVIERLRDYTYEAYRGVDFDFREGNQPVYSFIIGVE